MKLFMSFSYLLFWQNRLFSWHKPQEYQQALTLLDQLSSCFLGTVLFVQQITETELAAYIGMCRSAFRDQNINSLTKN